MSIKDLEADNQEEEDRKFIVARPTAGSTRRQALAA